MSFSHFIGHGLIEVGNKALEPAWKAFGQGTSYIAPMEIPNPESLMEAAVKGFLAEDQVEGGCRLQGVAVNIVNSIDAIDKNGSHKNYVNAWNAIWESHKHYPETGQWLRVANRQLLNPDDTKKGLRRLGYYDQVTLDQVQNLQYEVPGPADLVRFSVRHVFEPDLIRDLGYNEEFRPILDLWHRLQGVDYPLYTGPFAEQVARYEEQVGLPAGSILQSYVDAGIPEPTWARSYWWSHWVLPSPTQGYLMWQRLNPLRNDRWDTDEMRGQNFDLKDLNLLLRANDYPPKYRPLLAAISHPIPGIRFAREFRATGVYDANDLFDWAVRHGYGVPDAIDIATDIDRAVTQKEEKPTACVQCRMAESAYRAGVLDGDALAAAYAAFGVPLEQGVQRAKAVELELKVDRAKQVVSVIRSRYLRGELDDQQAGDMLRGFGIVPERLGMYLSDWALERTGQRKQVSAAQAQKWACNGLIGLDDLAVRLRNLGYGDNDVSVLSAQAMQCQQTMAAKAAAAGARAERQRQRDLIAAQRSAAQQLMQARRALSSHGTPAQLRRWYCEGLIGEPEVHARLGFLGWPPADIMRLIGDCKSGQSSGGGGSNGQSGGAKGSGGPVVSGP